MPRGVKRQAQATEQSAAKVAKTEAYKRVGFIERALASNNVTTGWSGRAAHAFEPEGEVFLGVNDGKVFEVLAEVVQDTLGQPASDRDKYQKAFAEMIGSALEAENKLLTAAVTHAAQAKSEAEGKRAACDGDRQGLEASLAEKQTEVQTKSEKVAEDEAAVTARKQDVDNAKAAQSAFEAEGIKVEEKKAAFEKTVTTAFVPIKEGQQMTGSERNKHINAIVKTLEKNLESVDESLLVGIPFSLKLAPDKRLTFDNILVDHLTKLFDDEVAACAAKIAAGEQGKADHAAAIAAAEAALEAAKAQLTTDKEAVGVAEGEESEIEAKIKACQKEAKGLDHEVKVATALLTKDTKVLDHFKEVHEMYREQVAYELPVEAPEPAAAEAEAPAEAPADAPAEAAPAEAPEA